MTTRAWKTPVVHSLLEDERGVSLIEVVVSAVLLVTMGLASFSLIDKSGAASSLNRNRTEATLIGKAQLDRMAQMPFKQLLAEYAKPTTINATGTDGRQYSVDRRIEWINDASGKVDCSTVSGPSQYMKLRSQVSWPGMGAAKPIVMERYRAPQVSQLGGATIGVRLWSGRAGKGTPGIGVSAAGSSGTTDDGGCVILGGITPGTVNVSWSTSGFVNENGVNAISSNVSATADSPAQVTGRYDRGGSAEAQFRDTSMTDPAAINTTEKAWTSVTAANSGITAPTAGRRVFEAGTATKSIVADRLFPFNTPVDPTATPVPNYGFYAGNCTGNDPATWNTSAPITSTFVGPGQSEQVKVELPRVRVRVLGGSAADLTSMRVFARADTGESRMSGCSEGFSRASGAARASTIDASTRTGYLNLPYGAWKVCIDRSSGTIRSQTARVYNTPLGTTGTIAPTTDSSAPADPAPDTGKVRGITFDFGKTAAYNATTSPATAVSTSGSACP